MDPHLFGAVFDHGVSVVIGVALTVIASRPLPPDAPPRKAKAKKLVRVLGPIVVVLGLVQIVGAIVTR